MTKDKSAEIVQSTGVNVAELASFTQQAVQLEEFLTKAPCKTAEQEAYFSGALSNVRALQKKMEDERTARTKPILAAKRSIDSLFTPVTKPLERCEGIIRNKLAAAALGRKEREAAAMLAAQTAAEAGDTDAVMDALAAVPDVVETTGSSVTYEWVVESYDVEKMDRFFVILQPDMEKLAGICKVNKLDINPPSVKGVVFMRVAKVRAR